MIIFKLIENKPQKLDIVLTVSVKLYLEKNPTRKDELEEEIVVHLIFCSSVF